MINWENINYDINNAKRDFDKLQVLSTEIAPIETTNEFEDLRQKLLEARDDIFLEYQLDGVEKLDYKFDLLFGIRLFEILNENTKFYNRDAMNDDLWRYVSIKIIPDIVHSRWGFNEDHFFKTSRRIWLKTIWWYINLSWMGNSEDTFKLLENNTTDTILQLVERPGIGYNVEMYRELMKQYYEYNDSSRQLFRRVLKLNTARLLTTSPELMEGGIPQYVHDLFEAVNK
ncbi:hypothetical protein NQ035_04245 [Staphylococcus gallinarum]|jgi:hypothetical protein|uniref:Uncharacterized protein n=1 Tax=Staphylococcus gallinarum TaxID=1293 RepID=A0A3A0GYU4_STAGA|nr:hypothetical protein [Staphylococcus gallinarum]MCQ9288077.1 hypothetical protein [Staphylococcus gallinarum]MEB6242794.1 hypothetical protein [Staphylococcus gallinarum]MEB6295974.1 hypothetical protein [Staphylococcus gallinarum]RIL20535.1 hypothetical protein BUY99_10170 [Staphylococcus gallinarum]RIL21458.1 hypothetical protein BUY97_12525 [Staphylococcus gallinarum]